MIDCINLNLNFGIAYKPHMQPKVSAKDDSLGHINISNLKSRVKNEGKVYKNVAAMLQTVIDVQKK